MQGHFSRTLTPAVRPLWCIILAGLLLIAGCQPTPAPIMEPRHLSGSAWTTYSPLDWAKLYQQSHEYPRVSAIVVAPDGSVWFGTDGGVAVIGTGAYRFDGKAWTHFDKRQGLPFDEISSMAVAQDGALWFGSYCCGAARFDGKSWKAYTTADGLASDDVRSIARAPDGAMWFGTADQGAARFDGQGWQTYTSQGGLWGDYVGRIFVLPDRSLLFSASTSSSAKLNRFDGQAWTEYPTPWTAEGKYTTDLVTAPDGTLWFGTEYSGIYHLADTTWQSYSTKDGLPSDSSLCAVGTSDSVWFGTQAGVARFDGKTWTTFNASDNVGENWVTACAAAPDGSLWFGYAGGIAHYAP